jgi:hypothetical protein
MRTVLVLAVAFALAACSTTNKNAPPPAPSDSRPSAPLAAPDGGAADLAPAAAPR